MDTISTELIKIATQIRERANAHRTAIMPDGYGGYEEKDIGPNEWLLNIANQIEIIGQEEAKTMKAVEEIFDLHRQVVFSMEKLAQESKSDEQKETPTTDKPPEQNHERFSTYDGALRTYKHETGNLVYDGETFEKFCKWLYAKCCEDDCPFYRVVEGEGECRPRCTNICGNCFDAREEAS